MNSINEIIKSRRSIRKFKPDEISNDIIREIIGLAAHAPSGCNSQCWKFVAVKDKDVIKKISEETARGVEAFYKDCGQTGEFISARINQATFFKSAPLVICVFMTEMKYHDQRVTDIYTQKGYSAREMSIALGEPDVLSIGAAVQNMLLSIHEKGLGACWMNEPVISSEKICNLLDIQDNCRLMSLVPVGVPAYSPRDKALKPMNDILTII